MTDKITYPTARGLMAAGLRACDVELRALARCHDAMEHALERALRPVEDGGYLRTTWDAADWLAMTPVT